MFKPKTTLTLLLLSTLGACTPTAGDAELDAQDLEADEADEAQERLAEEQDGARRTPATFEHVDDPVERAKIEELRASSCQQDEHAHAPQDLALELPRGLTEPRYRVDEDQRQASIDLEVEAPEPYARALPEPEDPTLAAQQRYLDQAAAIEAEFTGSPSELRRAKAELKAAELGE